MTTRSLKELGIVSHLSLHERKQLALRKKYLSRNEISIEKLNWQQVEVMLRDRYGFTVEFARSLAQFSSKLNMSPAEVYCANDMEIDRRCTQILSEDLLIQSHYSRCIEVFTIIMLSEYGFTWNPFKLLSWHLEAGMLREENQRKKLVAPGGMEN